MEFYIWKDGKAVPVTDVLQWAREFGKSNRQVASTEVDGVRISTVFLGMNHRYDYGSEKRLPPILWETMVFGGEHDQDQWRYDSIEKAKGGHKKAVAIVRGEIKCDYCHCRRRCNHCHCGGDVNPEEG